MENKQFEFDGQNILRDSLVKLYSLCHDEKSNGLEEIKKVVDERENGDKSIHIADKAFPQYIMLGKASYPLYLFREEPYNKILDTFSHSQDHVWLPIYFNTQCNSNIFVEYNEENVDGCFKFTHNIMWSFLSEIHASMLSISVFDCERHGTSITPFLEFRKKAPDVFDNKIFTDRDSIIERLKNLNEEIDERIQTKLGTKYESIMEYNNKNPLRGEIIRLLVVNDFPSGFDSTGLSLLENILKNGPKCGIFTIINYNTDVEVSSYDKIDSHLEQIKNNSFLFNIYDNECYCREFSAPIINDFPTTESMAGNFAEKYLEKMNSLKNKGLSICDVLDNVPFERTADESLAIPIGIGDGGHTVELILGTGSSHHALIAGATGSGKSTLLHTIILSSMMRYKPDELNLYLMDFKSGTEFKIYDTYRLPHIKLLALDAMQEFGESILENLVDEMMRRSGEFKKAGATKLSEYTKLSGNPMPRILVIMDEFQILFNDSANRKVANHCAELAKKIVTEGRSFGIHLLMATQSTAVISELSLSSGVVEQMRIRIGLKCGESDSRYLFKDNGAKAMEMMKGDLGTAVLNPEYTEKENIGFRVAYSNDAVTNGLLKIIEEEFRSVEYTMHTFEGGRTKNLLECYSRQTDVEENDTKVSVEVAEMIKVAPPLKLTFDKKRKHNILICGSDERKADNLFNILMLGILKNRNSLVYCVDGDVFVDEDAFMPFYRQYERFEGQFHLAETNGDVIGFIHEIFEAYKQRKKKKDNTTIFLFIRNLQFLELIKKLFKNEFVDESEYSDESESVSAEPASNDDFFDFGVSVSPEKSQGITAEFSRLISEGTGYGIHFILSCSEYQVVRESMYYSENSLSKFPERFIFEMNDSDADSLIPGVSVASLDENTVCYSDGINSVFRVKPYVAPDANSLEKYLDNGLDSVNENDNVKEKYHHRNSDADRLTAADKLDILCNRKSNQNASVIDDTDDKLAALRYMYFKGYGVQRDVEYSLKFFPGSSESNDAQVMLNYAKAYSFGEGVSKNYKLAAEWFQKAADKGNAEAMQYLGDLYFKGYGVNQNYELAKEWFQKAADKGEAYAMYSLGYLYHKGKGVNQNYELAKEWYQKAADKGEAYAMYSLGDLYYESDGVNQNYELAKEWYQKAADKGEEHAMNNLGCLYEKGYGVTKDYALAKEWYEKAAAKGNAAAMDNIGCLYEETEDYDLAKKWYEKAAARGDSSAMKHLGDLYYCGWGVKQDYRLAAEWYEKSATKGNLYAMNSLGDLYYYGRGVKQDYRLAAEWYEKAAKYCNISAMNNLGHLYENGYGVTQDYALAKEWYEKAADRGDATAMNNLGDLYFNGLGVDKNIAIAEKWYQRANNAKNRR